ncbi:MAG: aminopeptidase P family protein [Chloroflexi bacterium]|nr:aminopeptidase P family protein [Chloroflexota bacterium]
MAARLGELDVDAMLVTGEANRRYLSGFTGTAATLLISSQDRRLVTDSRYTEQATRQAAGYDVIENVDTLGVVAGWIAARGIDRLGVESEHTSLKQHRELVERLAEESQAAEVKPLDGLVEEQRVVKDEAELALLREAVRLADDVMTAAGEAVAPGMSERELSLELERLIREAGDGPSFPTIVAGGPNAAMAHHSPGERPIGAGEPVIVDLGVRLDGYCSDITRTFAAGGADAQFDEIYRIVLKAQAATEAGTRAGMTGRVADALAREVISDAGYGGSFGHGTGHGVGLEIHEAPTLSPRGANVLAAGAVVSVEPGIYLPNWGGVRIEDLVVVEADGVDVLTQAPK